jgi:hypothetical protein
MEHINVIGVKKVGGLLLWHWYVELPLSFQSLGETHPITARLNNNKDAFPLSSGMKRNLDKLRSRGLIAKHIKAKFPLHLFLIIPQMVTML